MEIGIITEPSLTNGGKVFMSNIQPASQYFSRRIALKIYFMRERKSRC